MSLRENIARLVGEGYDQPQGDQSTPLSINYAKINEWMLDRKLLCRDWMSQLRALQAGVAAAGGDPASYATALERAAATGVDAERSLLGGLKGQARVWDRLARAYEARKCHVAEAAQRLARAADYEAPALKRGMARAQQQLADLEKRKAEAHRAGARAEQAYADECKRLDISPTQDATAELRALASRRLPAALQACVAAMVTEEVHASVQCYAEFIAADDSAAAAEHSLPVLVEVLAGTTEAPLLPSIPSTGAQGAAEGDDTAGGAPEAEAVGVDDLDLSALASAGASGAAEDAGPGLISWDIGTEAGGDDAPQDAAGSPRPAGGDGGEVDPGIDWGLEVEGGEAAGAEEGEAVLQDLLTSANVFEGSDPVVQRLGLDGAYRAALADDLHELRAFLTARRGELRAGNVGATLGAATATGEEAAAWLATVERALGALGSPDLQHLLLLHGRPQYLARQAAALEGKRAAGGKLHSAAREAEARRATTQRSLVADAEALAALVERMRGDKALVEGALGSALRRRVIVSGEVNALLSA
ncbi:hypothetical protein ACKKBG_A27735 [Auxenochlorella protothecoides x Auxenochlorella symbiontica]